MPPFCTVFPEAKYREDMMCESRLRRIRLPCVAASTDDAFVLVPLQNVQEFQDDDDANAEDDADGKEEDGGSGRKDKKKKKKHMCPK